MGNIKLLENRVQTYAWGSRTTIAELLGKGSPSADPWAELWMGAHPKAPSKVREEGDAVSLLEVIARHPELMLGPRAVRMFGSQLPFLFKVLAAETPLSIQAHPAKVQAEQGFERENRAGIPLDAPQRNYRDSNHKPECLCALTPFTALCGFRSVPDIMDLIYPLLPEDEIVRLTPDLANRATSDGLKSFLNQLLDLPADRKNPILGCAVDYAEHHSGEHPAFQWIVRLNRIYPGDIGVLAPALLNLVTLKPGQALFLPPATLHTYLEGAGLEIMANSDNVLRGGLTEKHVDVAQLLRILVFEQMVPRIIEPHPVSGCEKRYHVPAREFELSVINARTGACFPEDQGSAEILICIRGEARLREEVNGDITVLTRGASAFVPASTGRYGITGECLLYRAFIPC